MPGGEMLPQRLDQWPGCSSASKEPGGECDNRPGTQREGAWMASKAGFGEQEWDALHKGVTGAGLLVSVADRDFTDSFGEAAALARRLLEEHEQSASELVRELAGVRTSGFGFTTSAKKAEAETLEALRSATAILAAKAPEEADAYRKLVLDVADAVANAKGGVKAGESGAIDKLKEALSGA